jgi:hypothetical protein
MYNGSPPDRNKFLEKYICVFLQLPYITGIEIDPRLNSISHVSTSINMKDKSSHHLDNKDRDSVPENGSSDSKILVNDLDYDIKGGTKQTSPILLPPLANTINNITANNSILHLMPSLDLDSVVGSFGMAYNDTDSDTINIKSNDNCKPMKIAKGPPADPPDRVYPINE